MNTNHQKLLKQFKRWRIWVLLSTALVMGGSAIVMVASTPTTAASTRLHAASARVKTTLAPLLKTAQSAPGQAIFLRIIKAESLLEVWIAGAKPGSPFKLLKAYPICMFSGVLGPKTKEGDMQAPEGIYEVGQAQLNPFSQFHLSFNLGYPNAFDRAKGYTGSALMVHGNCVSIGCYAMTDPLIEEIYWLMSEYYAAKPGAKIQVQALPFRLSKENLSRYAEHPSHAFWQTLAPIYQVFEAAQLPPKVRIGKRYALLR